MVMVQDEEGARQMIRERLVSKKWWVIIPYGSTDRLLELLEERFYKGERNGDFHLLVGPIADRSIYCVCLALKKWAPPKRLARLLQECGIKVSPELLSQRDLLSFISPDDDPSAIVSVLRWLSTRPGEEAIPTLEEAGGG
jgi:hypothetical protein